MLLSILEPLGVDEKYLLDLAAAELGDSFDISYYDTRCEDTRTLIERAKDADVVMLSNFKFDRSVMEHCLKLKHICVAFTGFDHIDMDYCNSHNISVSNCSGYANVAVSELVFGLVTALYRNIIACDKATRDGGTKNGLVGHELCGKTFGVIGAGAIGNSVLKIARAFGCKILANNSKSISYVEGVENVPLNELLMRSDIVSLHVPLNENTKFLINAERLSLMKKTAILINTARGPVVDNEALAQALNAGTIAGAGIDVFDTEPPLPLDYPLLHAKNIIVTPHVAFATKESMVKRAIIALDNVKMWSVGSPQNIVSTVK